MADLIPPLNSIRPNSIANPYANEISYMPASAYQYGVSMPMGLGSGYASSLGSAGLGILGAGLNFGGQLIGQWLQNRRQEQFYNEHMSPAARMREMQEAGINPNAAAQGIAGSNASNLQAASLPNPASPQLTEVLGNSVNTDLTASSIRSNIARTDAETDYYKSLNTEKSISNNYLNSLLSQQLRKAVYDGSISQHNANILAVDDYYHGAEAYAHLQRSLIAIDQMSAELQNTEQEYWNLLAQEYKLMKDAQLDDAQISKCFSDIGLNNAQIEHLSHLDVNIDAQTALTMQYESESKSRERLNRAHAQYQEKVNNVWNNENWNMNSDVNSNFHYNLMHGNKQAAETIMNNTKYVIMQTGEARANSKDYNLDKAVSIMQSAISLAGTVYMGNQIGNAKFNTGYQAGYNKGYDYGYSLGQ